MSIGKANAARGKLVEMRRLNVLCPLKAEVAIPKVIRKDQQTVWLLSRRHLIPTETQPNNHRHYPKHQLVNVHWLAPALKSCISFIIVAAATLKSLR